MNIISVFSAHSVQTSKCLLWMVRMTGLGIRMKKIQAAMTKTRQYSTICCSHQRTHTCRQRIQNSVQGRVQKWSNKNEESRWCIRRGKTCWLERPPYLTTKHYISERSFHHNLNTNTIYILTTHYNSKFLLPYISFAHYLLHLLYSLFHFWFCVTLYVGLYCGAPVLRMKGATANHMIRFDKQVFK